MAGNKTTTVSAVEMEDGVRLHVKILGDDSPKSKSNPLLIALHGAPGLSTHAEPEATFSHLSSVFRVLVFDARGSGESDLTGPYTHDRWIKDIENLRYNQLNSFHSYLLQLTSIIEYGQVQRNSSLPEPLTEGSLRSIMQFDMEISCLDWS